MIEIERKFLVKKDLLPDLDQYPKKAIVQHYLETNNPTIRLRQTNSFEKQMHNNSVSISQAVYVLTMKGERKSISRQEFEFVISKAEFFGMLQMVNTYHSIFKSRYLIPAQDGLTWEIDVFHSKNEGLIIAEIEVPKEDYQLEMPEWIYREISEDDRYSNFSLSRNPSSEIKD